MFQKTKKISFLYVLSLVILVVSTSGVFLPSDTLADTYTCDTPEQKAACTDLLNKTNDEIANLSTQLSAVSSEGASLARDKQVLDIKIKQQDLEIKAHQITIANLGKDIVAKTATIATLESKISDSKNSLSQILRQTRQLDDTSLPEIFLGNANLSDAFSDLDSFSSIHQSMQATLGELTDAKQANEVAKDNLDKKKDQETDAKAGVQTAQAKVKQAEAEKKQLLAINQTQQSAYQKVIADKNAQAAQIKAALFKLAGAAAIPFGTALQYAKEAQTETGVDPAFLLAIVTQESNLGANVGACYLSDTTSGAGINVNSGKVWSNLMKPSRDLPPFLDLTSRLGFDPLKTKVSCPIAGAGGYGGAMGPAQFIPSTWKLFEARIAAANGHAIPNPWSADDAFTASALYLTDLGAVGNSYSGQVKAACKYYGSGGATCSYGQSVMSIKAKIQANIDILNG